MAERVGQTIAKQIGTGKAPSLSAANDTGATSINAPELDKDFKAQRRAVSNIDQIIRICEAIFNPSSDRNKINGIIQKKYNNDPPFNQKQLENTSENWRHNFATGFMPGIINQVVTAPVDVIDSAQFLSSAKLDAEDDPDGSISTAYQTGLTKLIRSWSGWRTHAYAVTQEDVTFGYAAAVCGDPDDWRPREYRQDEFGVPDGTGQHASEVQFFATKRDWMIDEVVKKVDPKDDGDPEPAELGGWLIDNVTAELNSAIPQSRNTDGTRSETARSYQDLVREGNSGAAQDPQARTIDVYEFYARESNGKVSKYIVTRHSAGGDKPGETGGGHRLLFEAEDLFEKIEHCLTLYSLEPGNTQLYGSMGLGRKLINQHLAAERARNRAADQMYLASMIWMKSAKGLPTVQFKVHHPFGIIGTEAEIEAQAMPENIEPFLKLDERLSAWAEQAAGSYIPNKLGQDSRDRTAHEAVIEDTRENEQRQAYLKRFFGQFADEITMISRIACNTETRDPEALEFQRAFTAACGGDDKKAKILLKKFAEIPAAQVVQDLAQAENSNIIAMCETLKGNPFADQYKITKREAIAKAGVAFADDVLFPDGIDPTNEAEQLRLSILERTAMRNGESVPVSPRDNHKVHLDDTVGDLKQAQPGIEAGAKDGTLPPQVLDNTNAFLRHGEGHVKAWGDQAKALKQDSQLQEVETYANFFADAEKMLVQAAKTLQQAMAQRQAAAPPQAPQPAAPPQPGSAEHLISLSENLPYEKTPPQIQRQLEALFGLTPAYGASAANDWGGPTGGAPKEDLTKPQGSNTNGASASPKAKDVANPPAPPALVA